MYIYCLTHTPERQNRQKIDLEKIGYDYEFFKGIYGLDFSIDVWNSLVKSLGFSHFVNKKWKMKEDEKCKNFSNFINMLLILKDAIRNNRKNIIIIEDDTRLIKLPVLETIPKECEILLLKLDNLNNKIPKNGYHKTIGFYGCYSILYLNPEKTLEKILNHKIITQTYDLHLSKNRKELKIYSIYPYLAEFNQYYIKSSIWKKKNNTKINENT